MQLKLLAQTLEDIKKVNADGIEYWSARDLYELLGYAEWRNFQKTAITKAKESCKTNGQLIVDHFVASNKLINAGKGATRQVDDMELSRLACYLIAQNGDPRKPEIAFAQMYFAMATRKQELLEQAANEVERLVAREQLGETELEFGKVLWERDVDGPGIAEIRNAGDQALFGVSTKQMKSKLGVKKGPLANVLPTVTIKAKSLAAEITTVNAKRKDLRGKSIIKGEHTNNNRNVRKALTDADIHPEELPAEEDVHKIETRHKEQKKLK